MRIGKPAAFLCIALFLSAPAGAYQWPVEKKTVVATFGQSFMGDYYRGVGIAGKSSPVRPIDDGELVFYRSDGEDPEGLPSGLGSYLVLEHDQGIRSLYGHTDLSPEISGGSKKSFGSGDVLGTVGETGYTEGARLFLMVIDRKEDQIVNPYLILPPLGEKTRPAISDVGLSGKNRRLRLPASEIVEGGEWDVSARVYDLSPFVSYFCPTAPYRIAVYLNGQTTFQIAFDAVKDKEGKPRIYPSADLEHGALYSGDFLMKLGSVHLKKGLVNLEISVRDFAGNERSQSFQFRVN